MKKEELVEESLKVVNTNKLKRFWAYFKELIGKIDRSRLLFVVLFSFFCYFISELLNGNEIMFIKIFGFSSNWAERWEGIKFSFIDFFKFPKFLVNYLMIIFAYWILYGLTNRTRLSCTIILVFSFVFGVVNYIVTDLRGISITISDIYSIRTAINVAKGVKPTIEGNFIIATVLLIGVLVYTFKFARIKEKKEDRTTFSKTVTIILGVFGMVVLFGPNYFTDYVELWNVNRAYANSGAGLTIVRMVKDFKVKKPKKYDSRDVEKILAKYSDDTNNVKDVSDFPNVVVIMDESFADLDKSYDVPLEDDPISFFHELMNEENVISGTMHSSQFGGGTANIEYEFITGNVTAFLPPGAMPYQQYISSKVKQSIVSYMKKLGYKTYGMHSWDKSGYSREKIYKFLGFDNSMFKDSMPQLRHWIGEYPTDESLYEAYYDIMNNKPAGEKNFSFIVTMQNHMPYVYTLDEAERFVPENDAAISYFQAEFQSDKALRQVINYLKEYDEKTIMLFFGDHQPNVNQDYWYQVKDGYDADTASHVVPFFIWANYDIEEKSGIETSPNYFESILLDVAGMPKDSYTKYVEELREELPVITNLYCIDKNGNRYGVNDEKSPYFERLQEYWKLIYYFMFDA